MTGDDALEPGAGQEPVSRQWSVGVAESHGHDNDRKPGGADQQHLLAAEHICKCACCQAGEERADQRVGADAANLLTETPSAESSSIVGVMTASTTRSYPSKKISTQHRMMTFRRAFGGSRGVGYPAINMCYCHGQSVQSRERVPFARTPSKVMAGRRSTPSEPA